MAPTQANQVQQLRVSLDASIGDVNRRLDAMGGPIAYLRIPEPNP